MLTTATRARELRFHAMGSDAHVIVVDGPRDLCSSARARVAQLEARWTRFRADSELSRLNAAAGRPVLVSSDTLAAVDAAVQAWHETQGAFDPTVLPALVALGYDRDFAALAGEPARRATAAPEPAPGCAGIEIARIVGAVTLPPGTALDLGGIGKGLAADLVVGELLHAGARGACVNLGGDLRAAGAAPGPDGWVVALEHLPDVRVAVAEGAVATSSTSKRHWVRAGSAVHHLIDPRSGRPAAGGLAAVTVIAGATATAEALTKAAFVVGIGGAADLIRGAGATGVLVTSAGAVIRLPGVEEYVR